jgi:hypothetical protein
MVAALSKVGGEEKRYTLQNMRNRFIPCNERPQWLTARPIALKLCIFTLDEHHRYAAVLAVASGVRRELSHISITFGSCLYLQPPRLRHIFCRIAMMILQEFKIARANICTPDPLY